MSKITINPKIRFGKPCIRGTRIAVADILHMFSVGYSLDEIPVQYPGTTKKDVLAALEYVGKLADEPTHIFTKSLTV